MSEHDQAPRGEAKSEADQTLLGVAPPRIDSATDTLQRAPVRVRSGTSIVDLEPPPPSRVALPGVPPGGVAAAHVPAALPAHEGGFAAVLAAAQRRPALWMVLTPLVLATCVLLLGRHHRAPHAVATSSPVAAGSGAPIAHIQPQSEAPATIARLEARPPGSLTSHELVSLAEARAEQQRDAASALRRKVERTPSLAKDPATQAALRDLAADARTAREALAAMAALEPPSAADMLYDVWTGTAQRSDTTELARALVYSPDVRPGASPALAVALALRVAETCQQFQSILPQALKDGDRRAAHLLTKLNAKRGCGPKKASDCYACLREHADELAATINAVKSRRPPSASAE
jgi:hypothetical protein